MNQHSSRFITTQEVAERLDCSVEQVRSFVRRGLMQALIFSPKRWLFESSEVDAFLERIKSDLAPSLRKDRAA